MKGMGKESRGKMRKKELYTEECLDIGRGEPLMEMEWNGMKGGTQKVQDKFKGLRCSGSA